MATDGHNTLFFFLKDVPFVQHTSKGFKTLHVTHSSYKVLQGGKDIRICLDSKYAKRGYRRKVVKRGNGWFSVLLWFTTVSLYFWRSKSR